MTIQPGRRSAAAREDLQRRRQRVALGMREQDRRPGRAGECCEREVLVPPLAISSAS